MKFDPKRDIISTSELKEGARVILHNGLRGRLLDSATGDSREVEISGQKLVIPATQIRFAQLGAFLVAVEHKP